MPPLSLQERELFLSKPHVGVLGVEDPGRGPLTVPIWYQYEPGGDVVILTGPTSRKARLIEAAGRFSICAQQEELPYRYVMAEGPVVDTRPADLEADERPLAHRYLGEKMGDGYVEGSAQDGASTSIRITMRPERWSSVESGG
mgnify:CR=1 FL=1